MNELERRSIFTDNLVAKLSQKIAKAERLANHGQACVYATGSVGRSEAGEHSDMDLVIVTKGRINDNGEETAEGTMSLLDEICLKADVVEAMKKLDIKDLDGQGKFFRRYTSVQLSTSIGEQHDDWENTLTSRLLLILESRALIGAEVHAHAVDKILASYWTDYEGHQSNYVPAFFTNDILRLWRTFCVNYEARTKTLPKERIMERRIKNLKLKYSRMLTCYSAILFLLECYDKRKTVSPDDAKLMATITPVQRLHHVHDNSTDPYLRAPIEKIIERYGNFLHETNRGEADLIEYMTSNFGRMRSEAHEFGDLVFEALRASGKNNRFYRMIVV